MKPASASSRSPLRETSERAGTPRRGLLTQASVLTVTSNPTRTSPVKRGKWVLETLLGLDIVDEGDRQGSMQRHARRLWEQRARNMGLEIEDAE